MTPHRATRPYWSPYLVGAGLGLVVLATYVLLGFGPGASGAFAHVAAHLEDAVAPAHARANAYLAGYLDAGRLWAQWIVIEIVGVMLGGFAGAWWSGRFRWVVAGGRGVGVLPRVLLAVAGGVVAGFASRVAQGCTSGLALSGGAVLVPGAWAFLIAFMAAGFVTASLVRSAWR
jgi:uncharacterized membrane protein YedE/YeeE